MAGVAGVFVQGNMWLVCSCRVFVVQTKVSNSRVFIDGNVKAGTSYTYQIKALTVGGDVLSDPKVLTTSQGMRCPPQYPSTVCMHKILCCAWLTACTTH